MENAVHLDDIRDPLIIAEGWRDAGRDVGRQPGEQAADGVRLQRQLVVVGEVLVLAAAAGAVPPRKL